ncbi:MAG: class I SAM-dependent methyltransferase [Chitinophagales bacterium]|nr:class I SAM-dependent methyltransferase [Chitinophagales bacterium]
MNAVQNNIYASGEYLSKNPTWGTEDSRWKAEAINKLIRKNNIHPSTVAEIGCGYGDILIHLAVLNSDIKNLYGYDISPQAIAEAKKRETEHIKFFNADFPNENTSLFDLVLMIDVAEHVPDYLGFLKKLRDTGKEFIFHIPLDLSCRTIFKPHVILQQRNDVGHLHYFTREHVEWILKDCGYVIKDRFYTLSETDRNKARSFKSFIKKMLRRFSYFIAREASVKLWGGYSVMIYCQRND